MFVEAGGVVFGEDHLTPVATVEFDRNANDHCGSRLASEDQEVVEQYFRKMHELVDSGEIPEALEVVCEIMAAMARLALGFQIPLPLNRCISRNGCPLRLSS